MFKHVIYEHQFNKNGYCIIDIVNKSIVDELANIFDSKFIDLNDDLYVSNHSEYEENRTNNNLITNLISKELYLHFKNINIITSHFLKKMPNTKTGLQLHQDWSTTDEENWFSAHIWIPHQDTNINNGTMYTIPGSHQYFKNFRSGSLGTPNIKYNTIIKLLSKAINLKKGQMLVFKLSLFHGSFPNLTSYPRNATLIHIMEKNAPIVYYHKQENDIQELIIDEEVYLKDINHLEKGGKPYKYTLGKTLKNPHIKNKDINSYIILKKYLKIGIQKLNLFNRTTN